MPLVAEFFDRSRARSFAPRSRAKSSTTREFTTMTASDAPTPLRYMPTARQRFDACSAARRREPVDVAMSMQRTAIFRDDIAKSVLERDRYRATVLKVAERVHQRHARSKSAMSPFTPHSAAYAPPPLQRTRHMLL